MRKSELEKLRTLNATPAMIRALQEPGTKRNYSGKINEEKYHLGRHMGTIWKHTVGTNMPGMSMYIFLRKVADRYRSS